MKVIDETFNYKAQVKDKTLKFHKYFVVNFYSKDKKNLPTVEKVGDIVRLKRFKAKVGFNGEMFLTQNKLSNWLVYNSQGRYQSGMDI